MGITCTIKGIVVGSRERTLSKKEALLKEMVRGTGYILARRTMQADTVKSSPTTSHQAGFFPDGN